MVVAAAQAPSPAEELVVDDMHEETAPLTEAPSLDSNAPAAALSFPPALTANPVSAHRRQSLARAPSTPPFLKVLLPVLWIGTHYLFYYGQTADMWKLHASAHADVWYNATSLKTREVFKAIGVEDGHFHYTIDKEEDVEVFTYAYAIKQLWAAKKMPGKVLPRSAAVLLAVFSGVWPHLKLLLLAVTWWVPFGDRLVGRTPRHQRSLEQRTSILHWLATLGKWSLADVLTVCVMVGVLHLDWNIDPGAIKQGVVTHLPQLVMLTKTVYSQGDMCNLILKMDCDHQKNIIKKAECHTCLGIVKNIYSDPEGYKKTARIFAREIDAGGGGVAALRVVGMSGIYVFGLAVILSVLLSLIIDVLDHRARIRTAIAAATTQRMMMGQSDSERSALEEPLLGGSAPLELDSGESEGESREVTIVGDRAEPDAIAENTDVHSFSWWYMAWSVMTGLVVIFGADLESMERVVVGAGPELLRDILGVRWERLYSLKSLMQTTGAAGGLDYALLMTTFSLFCVFGPILRACLCVFVGIMGKLPSQQLRRLVVPTTTVIHFVGSFCAWEVFAIAIVMVDMLMPTITNTIIQKPICGQLSDEGSCLQVEFNVLNETFSLIIIGGFLLVATSVVASNTGRAIAAKKREQLRGTLAIPDISNSESEELVFETHQV